MGFRRQSAIKYLKTASEDDVIAVDEYISELEGTGDSGSYWITLEKLIALHGIDYLKEVLSLMTDPCLGKTFITIKTDDLEET
jgi:hypothetical protein